MDKPSPTLTSTSFVVESMDNPSPTFTDNSPVLSTDNPSVGLTTPSLFDAAFGTLIVPLFTSILSPTITPPIVVVVALSSSSSLSLLIDKPSPVLISISLLESNCNPFPSDTSNSLSLFTVKPSPVLTSITPSLSTDIPSPIITPPRVVVVAGSNACASAFNSPVSGSIDNPVPALTAIVFTPV